eukprot:1559958-Pyramimonas_sp.AAC.1
MAPPAAPGGAAGARGGRGGDGAYWACASRACKQWNYCSRSTRIGCQAKAPPWAVRHAAARPV